MLNAFALPRLAIPSDIANSVPAGFGPIRTSPPTIANTLYPILPVDFKPVQKYDKNGKKNGIIYFPPDLFTSDQIRVFHDLVYPDSPSNAVPMTCNKCKEVLPPGYFGTMRASPSGLTRTCQTCATLSKKEYRRMTEMKKLHVLFLQGGGCRICGFQYERRGPLYHVRHNKCVIDHIHGAPLFVAHSARTAILLLESSRIVSPFFRPPFSTSNAVSLLSRVFGFSVFSFGSGESKCGLLAIVCFGRCLCGKDCRAVAVIV